MDRPYDDIPRQGRHQGGRIDEEPSTSVRAPLPPDDRRYALLRNAAEGTYRIHPFRGDSPAEAAGYEPVGHYASFEDLAPHLPDEAAYVVLENAETGEAYMDRADNLSSWPTDGDVDQVTLFADETAAAAYVDRRKRA